MFEYEVFSWSLNPATTEELKKTLNDYAKDRWKLYEIVQGTKGLLVGTGSNDVTIILERKK